MGSNVSNSEYNDLSKVALQGRYLLALGYLNQF